MFRIRQANIRIERPGRIGSGKSNTFKHIHDGRVRKRDKATCYNQKNLTRRRDRDTGLSTTVDYTVAATRKLSIDGAEVNFLDVNLICDTSLTPWCNCTGMYIQFVQFGTLHNNTHAHCTPPQSNGKIIKNNLIIILVNL